MLPASVIALAVLANRAQAYDPTSEVPEAPYGWELVRAVEPEHFGDDRDARRMEAWVDAHQSELVTCFSTAVDRGFHASTVTSLLIKPNAAGGVKRVKTALGFGDDALDSCVSDIIETLKIDPPPQFLDKMRVNLRWEPKPPPPPPPPQKVEIPQPAPVYTQGVLTDTDKAAGEP